MLLIAICCTVSGAIMGWVVLTVKDLSKKRRKIGRELRTLGSRLETARRVLSFESRDGGGAVIGLASWMRNHGAKLLAKSGRQLEIARECSSNSLEEAIQIKREIELSLAALDILADFSQRYLEPMAKLQRQGAEQAFQEIAGLRQRLIQRIEPHAGSGNLDDELRQLDLLGRYITKELGEPAPADPSAVFRRLSMQLRALNDIEDGLRSKVGRPRRAMP